MIGLIAGDEDHGVWGMAFKCLKLRDRSKCRAQVTGELTSRVDIELSSVEGRSKTRIGDANLNVRNNSPVRILGAVRPDTDLAGNVENSALTAVNYLDAGLQGRNRIRLGLHFDSPMESICVVRWVICRTRGTSMHFSTVSITRVRSRR